MHTCIIVSTLINGFNYCKQPCIILFNINNLSAHDKVVPSIAHTNSFSCAQLIGSNYCYLAVIIKQAKAHLLPWQEVLSQWLSVPHQLTCLLAGCSLDLIESLRFTRDYKWFLMPTQFSSGFQLMWFISAVSYLHWSISLLFFFRNPQQTCCQRSISNRISSLKKIDENHWDEINLI